MTDDDNTAPLLKFKLARILDAEFQRVAKEEDLPLGELMINVSTELGLTTRQVHNLREGRTEMSATHIAFFCRRFGSNLFADLLRDESPVDVPDEFDLARLASSAVREALGHYERVLDAFEGSGIHPSDLASLEDSGGRVINTVRRFQSIAVAYCERRYGKRAAPGF